MGADRWKGKKFTPLQWAELLTPLTTLELAITVEKLGGWERVEILTPMDAISWRVTELAWIQLPEVYGNSYLNPHETVRDVDTSAACAEGWFVYDVRRRGHAHGPV